MRRKPDLAEHIERFSARGVAAKARATEARERNRAADPEFAAWCDEMRRRFDARLVRVQFPDGRTWRER